ncbi:hypothetical protein ACFL04_02235 [Patescibacteria group bacterium]
MNKSLYLTLKTLIWLTPIVVLVWISNIIIIPEGEVSFTYDQSDEESVITGFNKREKYSAEYLKQNNTVRDINADQANFFINQLVPFTDIEISLDITRISSRIYLTSVGKPGLGLIRQPLYLPLLDDYNNWTIVEDDSLSLWQRENKYNNIADFLSSPPPADTISVESVRIKEPNFENIDIKLEDKIFNLPLRGSHSFYVNVPSNKLFLEISKTDLNKLTGPDRLTVDIYDKNNKIVHSQIIGDDGDETPSEILGKTQINVIELTNLPDRIYRMEIAANDDVIIDSIKTNNELVIYRQLKLFDKEDENNIVEARGFHLVIINDGQNDARISLDDKIVSVKPDESKIINIDEIVTIENLNKVPVRYITDGGFIDRDFNYFDYQYGYGLLPKEIADQIGVDYVLANYRQPEKVNELTRTKASYQLNDLFYTDAGYNFIINIEQDNLLPMALGQVTYTTTRPQISSINLPELAKNMFKFLKSVWRIQVAN